MEETAKLNLDEGLSFNVDLDGHNFKIDTAEEFGGKNRGPKPKNLMLAALGGCTGMDVASMLRKMKMPYEGLEIKVSGTVTEMPPKHFDKMHITYIIKGKELERDKIERAVSLSQEKYCGVTYNFSKSMEITHEIVLMD